MSKYRSPIEVIYDDISKEIINEYEDQIVCEVRKIIGIDVDKKRLINALLLDKKLVWCKDCVYFDDGNGCILQGWDYTWEEQMGADDFCSRGELK